ncbi:hypothetical protein L873DRAFT_1811830 [Choiromyces venosus 120613-1]|uniref:Uncharacterized protein n=1 Tax=Choiromyces venosus 120613-1 TaxID=1336337 RepID=A0A3N4JQW0_9PEZI|nr:hypothetical protein L873DRAFT_1811830 [Choiromyces venosus 120613-1]
MTQKHHQPPIPTTISLNHHYPNPTRTKHPTTSPSDTPCHPPTNPPARPLVGVQNSTLGNHPRTSATGEHYHARSW